MPKKLTLEQAHSVYRAVGSVPLFSEYVNNATPHRCTCFRCPTEVAYSVTMIQQGNRPMCDVCRPQEYALRQVKRRIPTEEVKSFLLSIGSQLLQPEFLGKGKQIQVECVGSGCSTPVMVFYHNVLRGTLPRCSSCLKGFYVLRSGPNHPRWDSTITEEDRVTRRRGGRSPGAQRWYDDVKSRADYTCQITGQRGLRLSSHHIYSSAGFADLRSNLDNGICISETVHLDFHAWLYRTRRIRRCTKAHLVEYLRVHYPQIDAKVLLNYCPDL